MKFGLETKVTFAHGASSLTEAANLAQAAAIQEKMPLIHCDCRDVDYHPVVVVKLEKGLISVEECCESCVPKQKAALLEAMGGG